jgi:formylglycine-generating enzyme required for sulfatase activity
MNASISRGASYWDIEDNQRSSIRNWSLPAARNDFMGFRIARRSEQCRTLRVLRGGSWLGCLAVQCRCTYRTGYDSRYRGGPYGFRIASGTLTYRNVCESHDGSDANLGFRVVRRKV